MNAEQFINKGMWCVFLLLEMTSLDPSHREGLFGVAHVSFSCSSSCCSDWGNSF